MATIISVSASISPHFSSHHNTLIFSPKFCRKTFGFRCNGGNPTSNSSSRNQDSEPQNNNALLKLAWYSSELLGIAASAFRSPSSDSKRTLELEVRDVSGPLDRAVVASTIKDDFERSYFVTGDLTLNAYEEDCEFADPAGSFKGLQRFKRNCTNFGSLLEKSNMKLMKWEDFEVTPTTDTFISCQTNLVLQVAPLFNGRVLHLQDKGIGHWRFSCILLFPWRPILSATGYTEYYFDPQSGRVCRHVEHWNVPKMALFKQMLRPSKGFGLRDQVNRWLKEIQLKLKL